MSSDAATLPSPPSMPPWKDTQRPYSVGDTMHSGGYSSRPVSYSKGSLANPRRPRFPNIKDLQDQAAALHVNDTTPVQIRLQFIAPFVKPLTASLARCAPTYRRRGN